MKAQCALCGITKSRFISNKTGKGVGESINKKIGDKIPGFQQAQDLASALMAVTGGDKDLFKKYWSGDIAKGAFNTKTGLFSKKFWTSPNYSVCANKPSKDQVKCKNEADKKMVKALDAISWKDRQWGHAIARNTIATKAKVGKAVVIERFNRTLKNKMYKQFTIQGNTQYLEMLPILVKEYNNTKHSSIKMTPTEASKEKNQGIVYLNLYGDMEPLSAKPKFKVGDKVRISKYKRIVFDKGYTPNWSEEMFVITKIQHTNPITYKIKDLNDEEIKGSFYEPELLKAKQDVFRIDKVIRRDYKKKQALVKWKGYSDDFNSWIPIKDLKDI
ncbi:hypothetical protein ACROYT_G003774 [Oculina patagonica]